MQQHTHLPQKQKYACNILNLGNGRILSVHAPTARQIVLDPAFKGDVQVIDYSPITSMYGAVHCSSQVVKRAVVQAAHSPVQHARTTSATSATSAPRPPTFSGFRIGSPASPSLLNSLANA